MPTKNCPLTGSDEVAARRDLITFGTRMTRPEFCAAEERSRKGTFGTINELVVSSKNRPPGVSYQHLSFVTRFGAN